jgi:hypothetical protein
MSTLYNIMWYSFAVTCNKSCKTKHCINGICCCLSYGTRGFYDTVYLRTFSTNFRRHFWNLTTSVPYDPDILIVLYYMWLHVYVLQGPSWPWSYGSWIYNNLCNHCLPSVTLWVRISIRARCTTLCDKVCQWRATGRWFSAGPPVSSTRKTWPPRYNWNIAESGVKHHQTNKQTIYVLYIIMYNDHNDYRNMTGVLELLKRRVLRKLTIWWSRLSYQITIKNQHQTCYN